MLFQVLIEGTPVKSYKMQLPVLFISCCFISIFTAAIIFYDALEFHSTFIWEKVFITNFPFFNGFTKAPHPLNAEQLQSTKCDESFLLMLFPIEVI